MQEKKEKHGFLQVMEDLVPLHLGGHLDAKLHQIPFLFIFSFLFEIDGERSND